MTGTFRSLTFSRSRCSKFDIPNVVLSSTCTRSLARTEARLLRALADEVGAPTGQILALGIREGGKDGADKKRGPLSDELSQLRGGLATFIAAESGTGGESGSSVFQPRPWNFTRLGAISSGCVDPTECTGGPDDVERVGCTA